MEKSRGELKFRLGCWLPEKAEMAVVAAELGMDRTFQGRRIDLQGDLVTAPENDSHGMLVTAKHCSFSELNLRPPRSR